MKYLVQIIFIVMAIAVLGILQYQFWLGENGFEDSMKLHEEMDIQQQYINNQREYNRILRADVKDLKIGLEAVEEHARLDLGLIKPGETFVQISTASGTNPIKSNSVISSDQYIEVIPEPLNSDQITNIDEH